MCLGIPMQVLSIDGHVARCGAKGVERDVSLFLLQQGEVSVGDFVMVHVGYAIQRMNAADAATTWELFDRILNVDNHDIHNLALTPDKLIRNA